MKNQFINNVFQVKKNKKSRIHKEMIFYNIISNSKMSKYTLRTIHYFNKRIHLMKNLKLIIILC